MKKFLWMLTCATGALWALSWFFLYLEIYRWRHVSLSARLLLPPTWHAGMGGFVFTVLVASALIPPLFWAILVLNCALGSNDVIRRYEGFSLVSLSGLCMILFGIVLSGLAVLNHLIREPRTPIYIDLTMRRGNGGFLVNGLFLLAIGISVKQLRPFTKLHSLERRH